jgi:5-methylcytosine-specific restriction endonuclease McrA
MSPEESMERKKATSAAWYKANRTRVLAANNAWNKAHPDKVRAIKAIWYKANREQILAATNVYKKAHLDKAHTASAGWRKSNPEKIRSKDAAWEKANPEKVRAKVAKWRKTHPEEIRRIYHNKRARKKESGGKLSPGIISKLLSRQKTRCAICRLSLKKTGYHIDHVVPLVRGGKNTDSNIQLTCPTCNMQKNAKDPIAFMQSRGYLL